jgi:HPt (histidine-containing phosphotransfer) domain-containing protein
MTFLSSSTSAMLDLTGAKEFAPEGESLRELVQTFEQSLVVEMQKIEQAMERQDALTVEHSLHALKGFMPLFAHPDLAKKVTDLYQTSRTKPFGETCAVFNELAPNLRVLLKEVHAWPGIYDSASP